MALIRVNDLTFYYDGSYDNIFEKVTFQIDSDWKLGLIARNGRGKTTFLNLLMDRFEYRGTIESKLKFDYFPYVIPEKYKGKDTIEVIDFMDSQYELWKILREFTLLEIDPELLYRPFSTLSGGEQTKVMLAVLFSRDNYFLLIDEPANHLDLPARELVKDYLKGKRGFILVSHDRWFLDCCIDHVLVINKENIQVEQGNFSTWWENKERQDQYEAALNDRLKKDIRKLANAARQAGNWADHVEATKIGLNPIKQEKANDLRAYIGEKSRRMQKRRKNLEHRREKAIEDKQELLKNIETAENLKIIPLRHHKERLIEAKDLSIYYGDKKITRDISFTLNNGEIVVLEGKNGSGKSSILKKILGEDIKISGLLEIASGLKISYVSQDTSHLQGTFADFVSENGLDDTLFRAILRKLDFERAQFEKRLENLSGGQKKKILLARSLSEKAHLYIWDEPLNYIDIFSRMQLEQLIGQYRPSMLLVEHDKTFIEKVSARIIHM